MQIVGCGRWLRRDDQAGLKVAELLREGPPTGFIVSCTESPGVDLPLAMEGAVLLVIVDAAKAGKHLPAGAFTRIDWREARRFEGQDSAADLTAATRHVDIHTLSVSAALALGEELGVLPAEAWIYVVGGQEFGYGEELTPALAAALPRLAERIRTDVESWLRDRRS